MDGNNIISIESENGELLCWIRVCENLKEITGDDYIGGWKLI